MKVIYFHPSFLIALFSIPFFLVCIHHSFLEETLWFVYFSFFIYDEEESKESLAWMEEQPSLLDTNLTRPFY